MGKRGPPLNESDPELLAQVRLARAGAHLAQRAYEETIRDLYFNHGVTQRELAEAAGTSIPQIWRIIHGRYQGV